MIYTCMQKGCHYTCIGSEHIRRCPDCGKKQVRPATRAERADYFRYQTEAVRRRSG